MRVQIFFDPDENRTHQEFGAECDINNIMAKYQRTGLVDHVAKHGLHYGDFPAMDFREALEFLDEAQQMFDELPSTVRRHFDNDPAAFLEFVQDPENKDKVVELLGESPRPVPSESSIVKTSETTDNKPVSEGKSD